MVTDGGGKGKRVGSMLDTEIGDNIPGYDEEWLKSYLKDTKQGKAGKIMAPPKEAPGPPKAGFGKPAKNAGTAASGRNGEDADGNGDDDDDDGDDNDDDDDAGGGGGSATPSVPPARASDPKSKASCNTVRAVGANALPCRHAKPCSAITTNRSPR